jgi:glutamate synthase (NADPH/NADH) large chain
MSGGVAYLLDLDRDLVNQELVEIEEVSESDSEKLKSIISKFYADTGSSVAHGLLGDWSGAIKRFKRVMPRDYAKVLSVIQAAERAGRPVEDAIMEVLNG